MRTSRRYLDLNYIKLLPNAQIPNTDIIYDTKAAKTELNAYQKQLIRNKIYYESNKEEILKKQKEYQNSIPKENKARAKMTYFLNNDENYINKIKPTTIDKYQIKFNNGLWV